MPGRNIIKQYAHESYYHIYNRGVNKNPVFLDNQDYEVFLGLLKRYLDDKTEFKKNRTPHPNFYNEIDLVSFCLMRNHFHLFIYQKENPLAIINFMRSLTTAYGMYFNKKYNRVGPVFQQRYRAVRMKSDSQLLHITRYIHLNPKEFKTYPWSSYKYFTGKAHAAWVKPQGILEMFQDNYEKFVEDYIPTKEDLDELKFDLANY